MKFIQTYLSGANCHHQVVGVSPGGFKIHIAHCYLEWDATCRERVVVGKSLRVTCGGTKGATAHGHKVGYCDIATLVLESVIF